MYRPSPRIVRDHLLQKLLLMVLHTSRNCFGPLSNFIKTWSLQTSESTVRDVQSVPARQGLDDCQNLCVPVHLTKVALAVKGLSVE